MTEARTMKDAIPAHRRILGTCKRGHQCVRAASPTTVYAMDTSHECGVESAADCCHNSSYLGGTRRGPSRSMAGAVAIGTVAWQPMRPRVVMRGCSAPLFRRACGM